jgi:error-prone DNA polymerase
MSATLPSYAELHCRSNFTFLQGASHPEELVQRACDLAYSSLAITDECSLAGVVRAHVEAKKHGLHLIIGSEITLDCGSKLVFLACNRNGYGNLSELITLDEDVPPKAFTLCIAMIWINVPAHKAAALIWHSCRIAWPS